MNLATTVTELSAEDITARGSLTVGEALGQLTGVYVQTGGKGQSFVSIRGFEQRDVKVLIDGVPAHESYYGTVDLSMIPTEDGANGGREPEGRPEHVANLDLRYRWSFGVTTSLQALYTRGAYWEDPDDNGGRFFLIPMEDIMSDRSVKSVQRVEALSLK